MSDSGNLQGFFLKEATMNVGKTLFAQLMDFLSWTTFARLVTLLAGMTGTKWLMAALLYGAGL